MYDQYNYFNSTSFICPNMYTRHRQLTHSTQSPNQAIFIPKILLYLLLLFHYKTISANHQCAVQCELPLDATIPLLTCLCTIAIRGRGGNVCTDHQWKPAVLGAAISGQQSACWYGQQIMTVVEQWNTIRSRGKSGGDHIS